MNDTAYISPGQTSIVYRFLMEPQFRLLRHLLLIVVITIISFGQVAFVFRESMPLIGSYIYVVGLLYTTVYLLVAYMHLYYLIPAYLMKKKYGRYLITSSCSILALLVLRFFIKYAVYGWLSISPPGDSYFNIVLLLDNLSDFVLNMICLSGASMAVFLKYWFKEKQEVNRLETAHIQQEVNMVKEQVNPPLLFHILNHTADLVKTDPEKTSEMLFRLSQLLRYQLYDCGREKVLLSADLTFIENYLTLEQLSSGMFTWQLSVKGNAGALFISPFLLLGLVQECVKDIYKRNINPTITILTQIEGRLLKFTVSVSADLSLTIDHFGELRERLFILYPEKYMLKTGTDPLTGSSFIHLQLDLQ